MFGATVLLLPVLTMTSPPPSEPSSVARLATLLEQHVCTMGPHDPIADPGFLPGLHLHLRVLPPPARRRAVAYLGQHRVAGFADTLVDSLSSTELQAQVEVAHVLPLLPDQPRPDAIVRAAAAVADPTVRAIVVHALRRTSHPAEALAALRTLRPRERDRTCALAMDLLGAWLGGAAEADVAAKQLGSLDVEEVRSVMVSVDALAPAPQLAPLFLPWLDDKRVVGMLSHRNTVPYLVRDFGAQAIHRLGVVLDPPIPHVDHADAALVARFKKALATAERKPR
jgi:hypothetical protein